MTSDSVVTNPTKSPLAAIALKLVGLVTIISALLDYLILVIPPDFANPQWQLATTTQLVDRGIVPLVGIALILTGFWIDRQCRTRSATAKPGDRFAVLGLCFGQFAGADISAAGPVSCQCCAVE